MPSSDTLSLDAWSPKRDKCAPPDPLAATGGGKGKRKGERDREGRGLPPLYLTSGYGPA